MDASSKTFMCQVDTGAISPCTSPFTTTAQADGAHVFKVAATDAAGNQESPQITRNFTIDTTEPDTTITGGPTGLTNDDTPTFTLGSSIGGSTFRCKIDAGSFASCTSPYTPSLSNGAHTITVEATGPNGVPDSTPATRSVTVDTVAPVSNITSGPSGPTSLARPTFDFSSDELGSSFKCNIDNDVPAACTSPFQPPADLPDGPHHFTVVDTDPAGNVGAGSTRNFTVDTGDPDTSIDSGPTGPTNDASPSFDFSSDTSPATFQCNIDGDAPAACTSPFQPPAALPDGPHTLTVVATDSASNTDGSPATRGFTVDTAAPQTTIDSGPANAATTGPRPTWVFSSEAGATFECRVGGAGPFTACSSPYQVPAQAAGANLFEVQAKDAAGNVDPTASTRSFTVDTTEPDTLLTAGPGVEAVVNTKTPAFQFDSDKPGSTFECAIDSSPFAPCNSPYTAPALPEGRRTIYIRATDPLGNTDPSNAQRSFTVDTVAPDTTITGGTSGVTIGSTLTVDFTGSEAGLSFQCAVDGGAYSACSSPFTTAALANGDHSVFVRAVDGAGNADPTPAARTATVAAPAPSGDGTAGTPAGGSSGGGLIIAPQKTGSDSGPDLRFGEKSLKLDETAGAALVRITCPKAEKSCTGRASLTITGFINGKKVTLRLRAGSFKLAGGKSQTIKLKLSPRQLAELKKMARRRGALSVSVRDGSGNRATAKRTFTLR